MAFESDPIASKLNELFSDESGYGWDWSPEDPMAEQTLVALWGLQQEVYNGGFLQYFQNSTGNAAPALCGLLQEIGALDVIPIVSRAIALVGPNLPWDDEIKRFDLLDALPEENKKQLWDLGQKFYEQQDNLNNLLFHYLAKHRDQIHAPADFWTGVSTQ